MRRWNWMVVVLAMAAVMMSGWLLADTKPGAIEKTLAALEAKGLTLLAVQGKDEIKITTVEELRQVAESGLETVFFLMENDGGARHKVAVLPASDTGKSLGSSFWKVVCKGAGVCDGCREFFGQEMCR